MKRRVRFLLSMIFVLTAGCASSNTESATRDQTNSRPNIVIIYLDDLGYGDMSAYGSSTINTPNFDRLADQGVRFTQGYASSATCTPSRYALLTGQYPWRNQRARILSGTAPLLIDPNQPTLPGMLQEAGYQTAVIGKWHLGLGNGSVDWNQQISPGPNEVGFDQSYILAATQDRVPTVYIENGSVVNLDPDDPIEVSYESNFGDQPTGKTHPELLTMNWHHGHNGTIVNGIGRIGFMTGGESAKWSDIDMADHFLEKAQDYVRSHQDQPFFLYYALQQPHVPRTPHPRFEGATGMGPRGDAIAEADWCVGEFLKTLEEEGLMENTLIIFSSDNGPVVNDGYYDDAVEKLGEHDPAGGLRGGKYSLFEAGTRVPFVTCWKGTITPGNSDAIVCQMDLMASLAALLDIESPNLDSKNLLESLLGTSLSGREELVIEATSRTAFRQGDWVLIPPYSGRAVNELVNIELGNINKYALFNLKDDPGQLIDLADKLPDKLKDLTTQYQEILGNHSNEPEELELH